MFLISVTKFSVTRIASLDHEAMSRSELDPHQYPFSTSYFQYLDDKQENVFAIKEIGFFSSIVLICSVPLIRLKKGQVNSLFPHYSLVKHNSIDEKVITC